VRPKDPKAMKEVKKIFEQFRKGDLNEHTLEGAIKQKFDFLKKGVDELIADNVKSEDHLYRELLKAQKELQTLKEALNKFNIIFDGKILYDLRETIGEDKWNALSDCYDKLTKLNP